MRGQQLETELVTAGAASVEGCAEWVHFTQAPWEGPANSSSKI